MKKLGNMYVHIVTKHGKDTFAESVKAALDMFREKFGYYPSQLEYNSDEVLEICGLSCERVNTTPVNSFILYPVVRERRPVIFKQLRKPVYEAN
jgi:hypothetical protein